MQGNFAWSALFALAISAGVACGRTTNFAPTGETDGGRDSGGGAPSPNGGASTGGSGVGGANAGGANTGGSNTGGTNSNAGGTNTGGANTNTGGTNTSGTNAGGANTGGLGAGGANTGGVDTDAGSSGGATSGGGTNDGGPAGSGGQPDASISPDGGASADSGSGVLDGSTPDGCGSASEPTPNQNPTLGPVYPAPSTLWQPPASFTPPTGTYVYLASDSGDYIGAGQTYTYTQSDAVLRVIETGRTLIVDIEGDERWRGYLQTMDAVDRLEVGYYPDLPRNQSNAVEGGLDWFGEGRGCNTLIGWFAVDSVTRACDGALSDITLRFEQHCEGGAPALRGQMHWNATDTTTPPRPIQPPPSSLWQPEPGATPASSNYVYLVSDTGDYIGQGQTLTYTEPSSTLTLDVTGAALSVTVTTGTFGSFADWHGNFEGMTGLAELVPGYYPDLQRWPFHNPARGGLSWSGQGRGCNTLVGWFVIDTIDYQAGSLHSLDLRFEQNCSGVLPALRGEIHYVAP